MNVMTVSAERVNEMIASDEVELLENVRKLIPVLRGRTTEAQKLRRLPDETIEDLTALGVFKLTAPRSRGGREVSLKTFNAIEEALSSGCASTAWVSGIYNGGCYMIAPFTQEARDEFYSIPNPRAVTAFTPSGQAIPVDGGYKLTGAWRFGTGQHHAHWAMLSSLIINSDGPPEVGQFLLPMTDVSVADDWQVSGLAATGSNTVSVADVFVPAYRVLNLSRSAEPVSDAYYSMPAISFFTAGSCGIPLGLAAAAVDLFHDRIHKRGITFTQYDKQNEAVVTHLQMDEAVMKLEEARFHAERCAESAMRVANDLDNVLNRVRTRAHLAWCLMRCREVVEVVQKASGASAIHLRDPLQLMVRDVQALSLLAWMAFATNAELHGRVECGLQPAVPWF